MLLRTILFVLITNQRCGYGISNRYIHPLKNGFYNKNHRETVNGWKPLIQRSIDTHYTRSKGLESELKAYVTPQPLRIVARNSTERLIINNNRKETNDSAMTLQIAPFSGQNKDNRQDLDTIIDNKIEKSLERFFYKFDKMLETVVQDAVKKLNIHQSPTETGNGVPNNTGTLDYTAEEEEEDSGTEPNGKSQLTDSIKSQKKADESVPKRVAKSVHTTRFGYNPGHSSGYNSAEHSPPDPFVALFLSHYGKYLPQGRAAASYYGNLYSYLASNNLHNNKPFGSYKIYEDVNE